MIACRSVGLAFAVLLVTPLASAQPATTPKAAAQESYGKGVHLANLADAKHDPTLFEAAYLQFAQAYAIYPDDKVLWNLAASELRTKRFVEALHHFRLYDAHEHILAHSSHPEHSRLVRLMGEASNATGRLKIAAPSGAEISVDGAVVGAAPLPDAVDVLPGEHRIDAKKDGLVLHGSAKVDAGQEVRAELAASVIAPVVQAPLVVPAPVVASPVLATDRDTTARDALRWGTAGVALVGLAVGVGFFVAERSKAGDFNSLQSSNPKACAGASSPSCVQAHASYSDISQRGTIAGVGFVVGGIAAVSSAALWLFWPKPESKGSAATWLTPYAGAGSYGIDVGGRF
jgi:hypothetical protein